MWRIAGARHSSTNAPPGEGSAPVAVNNASPETAAGPPRSSLDAAGTMRVVANLGASLAVRDARGDGPARQVVPLRQLPLVVAGDLVRVAADAAGVERAVALLPRSTVLERPGEHGRERALAANLDALVVVSAAPPGIDTLLIDQFCVGAHRAGLEAIVVVNKADLLDPQRRERAETMLGAYRSAGHRALACSAAAPGGLDGLEAALEGRAVALVGASGTGKSSIVAALLPELEVRVGELSAATGLGAHTTSVTAWYGRPGGGAIVDSPGVRRYAVETLAREDVRAGFAEIRRLGETCRFNDCLHVVEPGCAVREALEAGTLSRFRYANYRRLAGV